MQSEVFALLAYLVEGVTRRKSRSSMKNDRENIKLSGKLQVFFSMSRVLEAGSMANENAIFL